MFSGAGERNIRIVLADDHSVVRSGLKLLLDGQHDMDVVGEAADGEAALHQTRELAPDVLVMDLSMPILTGAQATERVFRECPAVKVIALTVHEEHHYLTQLLRAHAAGYVLKRSAAADLVNAVRVVAAGGTYIDPSIAGFLAERYTETRSGEPEARDVLSPRETAVLVRIARGFSNKAIAAELDISVKTVETYKSRVAVKLGFGTRVDFVRYAAREGWFAPDSDTF